MYASQGGRGGKKPFKPFRKGKMCIVYSLMQTLACIILNNIHVFLKLSVLGSCFSLLLCVREFKLKKGILHLYSSWSMARQGWEFPLKMLYMMSPLWKSFGCRKSCTLMYMQGFLLFCDKIEMNKSPSLHMAFINFPEIFKGQKGQAQQRKRANIGK